MSSVPPAGTTGLTYADLLAWPEPSELGYRYELLDGELLVTPSPVPPHQAAVVNLTVATALWTRVHGGRAFVSPSDIHFGSRTVLQPDVYVLGPDRVEQVTDRIVLGPPTLAIEVSSPSSRRVDLVRKRRVYEREGVAEFWFVDLDADEVHCYHLGPDGSYGPPTIVTVDGTVTSRALPGLSIPASEAFGH